MLNNKEFYPTPESLIKQLISKDISIGNYSSINEVGFRGNVLEPSAGKGDIADYIKRNNRVDIDLIEYDEQLVSILYGKGYNVVWRDFLTYETHKQYDNIILNPPFSNGDEHLLKAIELGESNISKDCNIYAILNAETIKNPYSKRRRMLVSKLQMYGADIRFMESAFESAERKTNVEVALITLTIKPKDNSESFYKGIVEELEAKELETSELSTYIKSNELSDVLRDIPRLIKEYDALVELTNITHETNYKRDKFLQYVENINDVNFYFEKYAENLDSELDRLRSVYWQMILNTDEFTSRLTSGARSKLLQQVELAKSLEINEDNVFMLLSAMIGNRSNMIEQSIVGLFDRITQHSQRGSYTTNIHMYNGWYTNDAFKINKKIIYPIKYSAFDSFDYGTYRAEDGINGINAVVREFVKDISKAFELFVKVSEFERLGDGEFENNILRFKMFKKGTLHVWFKDTDTLDRINVVAGRHYNWLPTEEDIKTNPEAKEYMQKEFGKINLLS